MPPVGVDAPFLVDALDRVWFGTEGGVSMYDGKRWVSWTHKDGLGAANSDNLPASTKGRWMLPLPGWKRPKPRRQSGRPRPWPPPQA